MEKKQQGRENEGGTWQAAERIPEILLSNTKGIGSEKRKNKGIKNMREGNNKHSKGGKWTSIKRTEVEERWAESFDNKREEQWVMVKGV